MKLNMTAKIAIAAVVYVIIAQIINNLSAYLTMSYYLDPNYFPVWSKIMMPGPGPPPMSFFYYSIGFAFITGLIFSFAYSRVRHVIAGKGAIQKGLRYGFGLFLIAGLSFFFSMYLLINLPLTLLLYWLFFNLLAYLISGIAIAKIVG